MQTIFAAIVAVMIALNVAPQSDAATNSISPEQVATMVSLDPITGDVYIDWREVRRAADGKGPAAQFPMLVGVSKVLIAVKDRKWKPMSERFARPND